MNLTTLLALGAPALIASVAYALKKWADTRLTLAEVRRRRISVEAAFAAAKIEQDKAESETTGRIVAGREADAQTIRNAFASLQARLDRCEARHDASEARHEAAIALLEKSLAAKEAQIKALWVELQTLRSVMDGDRNASLVTATRGKREA